MSVDRLTRRLLQELAALSGADETSTVRLVVVRSAGQVGLLAEIEREGRTDLLESAGTFPLDVLRTAACSLRCAGEEPKS